jgi:hypothetical protein
MFDTMCTQVAGQKVTKVLGAEELSPSTKLVQVLLLTVLLERRCYYYY